MADSRERKPIGSWPGADVALGESRDIHLAVSESYSSLTIRIPLHVRRAAVDGPIVFVTAALHGDEINGTGAVRQLVLDPNLQLLRGALVLVPVLNILAFDRHSRYLPDRRDLNRCFPGSTSGSQASRMARTLFDEIVARCDYGVDLHTASIRRTNYPSIRGDLKFPEVRRLAESFGAEVIIDSKGPSGALRREACQAGCPTIVMEGGEVWKVEPAIVETTVRGIRNVLAELQMIAAEPTTPDYQLTITKSKWIRAEKGGFLQFHIRPGDIVAEGQPLATNTTLLGREQSTLQAPYNGVVIGMTTLPAVSPGEPVCNLGRLPSGTKPAELRRRRTAEDGLEERVAEDLASNILVVDPTD